MRASGTFHNLKRFLPGPSQELKVSGVARLRDMDVARRAASFAWSGALAELSMQ
jgi:hypothetical protein